MKRLLIIGFAACAFALTPTLSVSAMPLQHRVLLAAPMQLSFRSKVATATVMVTAIWVGAVAVIITDGAEAEDIIMVGVIIATIAITGD